MDSNRTSIRRRLFVVALFVLLSSISLVFSTYLLLSAKGMLVFFLAISFAVLALVSCVFNSVTAYAYYKSYFYDAYLEKLTKSLKPIKKYPTVAVILPTYKESIETIEQCMRSLKTLVYEKDKIRFYMHDDSKDQELKAEKEALCKREGFVYVTRPENKNFKAGALNNVIKQSKEEFIAVFDADEHVVNPNFLVELLPYFGDKNVSFVQAEKSFERDGSLFSDSVNLCDALFFKFMQPSRALHGTAVFAGSCGIIRHSALDAVGGFPEFVTEDAFFSFESDMHNFKSVYIPKVYALGKPLTFSELVTQQWRYNYGDTQFLFYFLKRMKEAKKSNVSIFSKIDYFSYGFGLNYLSSVLILFTLIALITVFSVASFSYSSLVQVANASSTVVSLQLLGIAAFMLSLTVPVVLTKAYFNSYSKGLMLFVLNFALAFARLKGAIAALIGMTPGKGWLKGSILSQSSLRGLSALKSSGIEVMFSSVLLLGSLMAAVAYNISGAFWLLWYGILYTSAFFLFYRYG